MEMGVPDCRPSAPLLRPTGPATIAIEVDETCVVRLAKSRHKANAKIAAAELAADVKQLLLARLAAKAALALTSSKTHKP